MPYIGKGANGFGIRERYRYSASGGQTDFTSTDLDSKTLQIDSGSLVDVYLNGVLLDTADYNTNTANQVTLTSGATASDEVMIVVYDVFSLSDAMPKTGGTFSGGIVGTTANFSGNITGTLATASQSNITSVGTLTNFTSTGIDDNADATSITIDSAENIGIKTTPKSWHSNWTALDFGDQGHIGHYDGGDTQIGTNLYHDGAWKAKETGISTNYTIGASGYHIWYSNPSANADASVTMTERMRINPDGNVGIGQVPYSHHANWSHLDIGEKCGIGHYDGGDSVVSHNNYYDGQWKAKATGIANQLNFTAAGQTIFRYADSTSADGVISWQNTLEINTDGTVKIGVKDQQPNNAWALRCFNTHGTHATIEGWNDNSGGKNLNLFRYDDASIFQVSNGGAVWAAGGYSSDKAFKNIIGDCTEGWSKLKDVQPKSYRYKNIHYEEKDGEEVEVFSDEDLDSNIHYGVIAQDLKKVLPDITYGEEGKMSVDYHGLLMVAINTIKELEARIKALEEA